MSPSVEIVPPASPTRSQTQAFVPDQHHDLCTQLAPRTVPMALGEAVVKAAASAAAAWFLRTAVSEAFKSHPFFVPPRGPKPRRI